MEKSGKDGKKKLKRNKSLINLLIGYLQDHFKQSINKTPLTLL